VATQAPPPNSAFLAPRHWPTWLGIGALSLVAWLPFGLRMAAGRVLGLATWLLASERRYITEVNIRLCFPELDARGQADLVRETFIENGIGLIETATG
jgi:KDO2-lipid IV(A) lauroyltransferase